MEHKKIGRVPEKVRKEFGLKTQAQDVKVDKNGLKIHMLKRHHEDVLQHIDDLEVILREPDFIGVNPREKSESLEYVKRFDDNVLVAIKLHKSGEFFYVPTMYRLQEFKLKSRIDSGRLKKIDKMK